jgi:hypothetical protein
MPFHFTPNEHSELIRLLARQSYLRTPDRQIDFVDEAFASSPDAKIVPQIASKSDARTFAVAIVSQLGIYDSGRATGTFLRAVRERLGGSGADAEFVDALLAKYFAAGVVTPPAPPTPLVPAAAVLDPNPLYNPA